MTITPEDRATAALALLSANGGRLNPQPDQPDDLARVLIEFELGADRGRCRTILAEMKADPAIWSVVAAISREAVGDVCTSSMATKGRP